MDKRSAASLGFFAVFVAVIIGIGALILYITREDPTPFTMDAATADPTPWKILASAKAQVAAEVPEGGPVDKTISDRAVRDDVRRRILAAWAESSDPKVASAARDGRFEPIPSDNDAGAKYIQTVVREEFFPLAKKCYEDFLGKKDAGGRLEMKFTIVGDQKVGGVVDDVDLVVDGGIDDEELLTCMRESFLGVAFRPPPKDWITVVYPIELHP